jgi:hypothetical protein
MTVIEETKQNLETLLNSIDTLFVGWLEHEKSRDNAMLRMELTFVVRERSNNALNNLTIQWPVANKCKHDDIRHSIFIVPQSDIYYAIKCIYENNCTPLKLMIEADNERLFSFCAEAKTRLLWCAESIVRLTANSFFVGKIHNYIKSTSGDAGTFAVHTGLKTTVPARDRQNLKITWGIRAAAQPSYFQRDYISDNRLETVATMKRAIRNHKGKIDFPTVYVYAMASFWVTTQRFSICV